VWLATGQNEKSAEPGGRFHCDTCIEQKLYIGQQCGRFSLIDLQKQNEILAHEKSFELPPIDTDRPNPMTRLQKRINQNKKRLEKKRVEKSAHIVDEELVNKAIDRQIHKKNLVVFKEDGFEHTSCPATEMFDRELVSIMEDVLYCMELNMPPNEGGALDQSHVFRVAYMTLKNEKALMKYEAEQEIVNKSKDHSKTRQPRKR
jgi:hypothetical protein